MGYTPAVAACAAALLAPAAFARRGSSGPLCRTDQNADNYRFHSLAETYSSDNSDCTYSASRLCMKYNLGVPCPKTGLWMWIDNGQGLTGDHGPITDMLAEKYLGDKSLTLTVPEGQQGVLQGRCTGEGLVGCTQLGARIDLVSSALHMSHIAIAGQSAIAQPTYTLSFPGHQSGGAIYLYEGSLWAKHCLFDNNDASDEGGAIMAYFALTVEIKDSAFTNNHVDDVAGGDMCEGGAIYVDLTAETMVERTRFEGNVADSGGAIYVQEGSTFRTLVLADCSGKENVATDGCGGNAGDEADLESHGGHHTACMADGCALYWSGSQAHCLPNSELLIPESGALNKWAFTSLTKSVVGPGGSDCSFTPMPSNTLHGSCGTNNAEEIPNAPPGASEVDGVAGSCTPGCRIGHVVHGETEATCLDETDVSSIALGMWKGWCGPPSDEMDLTDCGNIGVLAKVCCPAPAGTTYCDSCTNGRPAAGSAPGCACNPCEAALPKTCGGPCSMTVETFWHNCQETLGQIPGVQDFYNLCAGLGSGH